MTKPLIRVYVNQPLAVSGTVVLEQPQSHYVTTVMRHTVGDNVELFNGKDGAWAGEIIDANRKHCALALQSQTAAQEIPPDLWLCMAPLKKDRIDWTVEKACELGVAEVVPVITERTVVGRLNLERLTAHMVEAAEQCGRTHVPAVYDPVGLLKLLKDWPTDRQLLFCDEAASLPASLDAKAAGFEKHAILIGPEGGFTNAERQAVRAIPQARTLSLGPRILRADTAAVAAIALFQSTIGDW